MINRIIKDSARQLVRNAFRGTGTAKISTNATTSSYSRSRGGNTLLNYDLLSTIITAATYLGSRGELDVGGWEALCGLEAWLGEQARQLWGVGARVDPEDEDVDLIKAKGQYVEIRAMVLQAMQRQDGRGPKEVEPLHHCTPVPAEGLPGRGIPIF